MGVNPALLRSILHPDREMTVSLSLTQDDGEVGQFMAYRVQHNNALGPVSVLPSSCESSATPLDCDRGRIRDQASSTGVSLDEILILPLDLSARFPGTVFTLSSSKVA